ncbi:MAG TPA: hypothetical protein VJR47_17980 [Stellaceae bacterium]|nr:hypothetical protein [Stellaceae bacterium]
MTPARSVIGVTALAVSSIIAGCAGGVDAQAAKNRAACPRGAAPAYVVTVQLPAPTIDDSLTLAQIAERSHASYRYLTLGATVSNLLIVGVATSRLAPAVGGGSCAYPQQVSLVLALGERVIHVAREFHTGEPCVYDEILGHERRHAALDDKLLGDEKIELPSALPERFADLDGVWGQDEHAARDALQERLQADTQALQAAIEEKRRAAHAAEIDTFEERHRLANACGGRLRELYPGFD